jgi:hypothetical protein
MANAKARSAVINKADFAVCSILLAIAILR